MDALDELPEVQVIAARPRADYLLPAVLLVLLAALLLNLKR